MFFWLVGCGGWDWVYSVLDRFVGLCFWFLFLIGVLLCVSCFWIWCGCFVVLIVSYWLDCDRWNYWCFWWLVFESFGLVDCLRCCVGVGLVYLFVWLGLFYNCDVNNSCGYIWFNVWIGFVVWVWFVGLECLVIVVLFIVCFFCGCDLSWCWCFFCCRLLYDWYLEGYWRIFSWLGFYVFWFLVFWLCGWWCGWLVLIGWCLLDFWYRWVLDVYLLLEW